MADFAANVPVCNRCDRRDRRPDMTAYCTVDGLTVNIHANADRCPLNKFPAMGAAVQVKVNRGRVRTQEEIDAAVLLETKGWGDKLEAAIEVMGLDRFAAAYERLTGKPCGCESRKQALNKIGAWVGEQGGKLAGWVKKLAGQSTS